jgi:AcrR family transcriptional regulator
MTSEPTGTRRQQAEERRKQILDAACRVFSEKGFAGASMRDIAREVGVTEGLLYHYFENKEQLIHATWKERSWRDSLERILAVGDEVPLSVVLKEMASDFLHTLYRHGDMARMCVAEMQRNEELARHFLERIQDNQKLIIEFFRKRQSLGQIKPTADVEMAAGLLMGFSYSVFLLFNRQDRQAWDSLVEETVHRSVDLLLQGISQQQGC